NLSCTGNGLRVGADNVTLDLNGHEISGDGGSGDIGIDASARNTVTVRNGTVVRFDTGVEADASNDVIVEGLTIAQNTLRGVDIASGSDRTVIRHNLVAGNGDVGIQVISSADTKVLSNKVIGNKQTGITFNTLADSGKIDGNNVF